MSKAILQATKITSIAVIKAKIRIGNILDIN